MQRFGYGYGGNAAAFARNECGKFNRGSLLIKHSLSMRYHPAGVNI